MSSYGHKLVPKRGVQVPKKVNIGFFAPKPYLKGVDRDFLFDRKFCLVDWRKFLAPILGLGGFCYLSLDVFTTRQSWLVATPGRPSYLLVPLKGVASGTWVIYFYKHQLGHFLHFTIVIGSNFLHLLNTISLLLEVTARYAGLLIAPAEAEAVVSPLCKKQPFSIVSLREGLKKKHGKLSTFFIKKCLN